jgi:protein-tyrosine phosphatase
VIDLHCHILPGLDDGPATPERSVALARELAVAGVGTVAATPHLREDHPRVVPAELAEACRALEGELERVGVRLSVVSGAEVDLFWALEASDAELRLASYAGRGSDLLVETPYGPLLPNFEEQLLSLCARGFRVLLAHPERNPSFQAEPERLAELVRRGVLVQVTAGSLLRPRRSRSGGLARALLRDGLAHVIASDAHGASAGPTARAPGWEGLEVARSLVGEAQVEWLVSDAPQAVLAGEELPARPAARRSRWAFFRSR